ncbi:MAG TPA: NADH-quinone oxidoreductase subunit C [Gaiellaceae bacterium]|nr:NADH-quinone oxidoreductase subunit C [Gaiellaceae bacterium]
MYEGTPGFVEERVAHGETTVVVEPAQLVDAGRHLRDEEGFNFLSDITAVDYLGWGKAGVSGYIGTAAGRDLNTPMTQGYQVVPLAKPKRFAVNYHLLSITESPRRVRLQVWLDEGEPVATVIPVWPTADWHEREAWDLMGVAIEGHPNLKRILLDDDWEGHPLRKDYPLGGEPVRFSGEE